MLGGWVHETSLCSIFAISCRSVIISNWKLKCKNYWGILCLDISWTLVLVSQPSCRVEGPSLPGKDGCWAPESQHLKQNYFSRARWKGGMLWVSGNGAPLGTLNLQLKKKNKPIPSAPQAAKASSFKDTRLAQEVLFSLPFTFSYKAASYFELIPAIL